MKKSKQINKTLKVNNYIKKFWKGETNIYSLEQDCNCVHKDQSLNTSLYYKDYLHLIESGNDKFEAWVVKMVTKLTCENSPLTPLSFSKSISFLSSASSLALS